RAQLPGQPSLAAEEPPDRRDAQDLLDPEELEEHHLELAVGQQLAEQEPAEQLDDQAVLARGLEEGARLLEDRAVLDPRGARRLARAAVQALVEVDLH